MKNRAFKTKIQNFCDLSEDNIIEGKCTRAQRGLRFTEEKEIEKPRKFADIKETEEPQEWYNAFQDEIKL